MAIIKELFERTSTATHTLISQINFKSTGVAVDAYYLNTVNRPDNDGAVQFQASYTKVIYAKVSGTYNRIERPRWRIEAPDLIGNDKVHLFVGMRDSYTQPVGTPDYTLTNLNEGKDFFPNTGVALSPTTYTKQWLNDTTFYTNYLVLQVYVQKGTDTEFLNSEQFEVKFEYDTYE